MFQLCPHCGEEALIKVEAVYQGFEKVGERRICTSCGQELSGGDSEESQKESVDPLAALFGDLEEETGPDLFNVEEETARLCRKCRHYVLHPFTQICAVHDREVQATDSCPQFESKPTS